MSDLEQAIAGRPGWQMRDGRAKYEAPNGNRGTVAWDADEGDFPWSVPGKGANVAIDGGTEADVTTAVANTEQQAAVL